MKVTFFKLKILTLFVLSFQAGSRILAATVTNPVIWADIPDPSVIRVDDKYYMSSTTMHMSPGVPIMESDDMVHWKTVSYCYSTLCDNNKMNLSGGENAYGKGTWASSLRYKDGVFYLLTFSSTSGHSHLFKTSDPGSGNWEETLLPFWHDPSLFLDDDGRNYVVYGNGTIRCVELNADLSDVKDEGVNTVVLQNPENVAGSSFILGAEGTHVFKHEGYYYIFNICWPNGSGRTQICHRSRSITGPYEGKVVLNSNGVAQGSVVQMTDDSWMGYLFQDNGSVGRSPWLVPVTWENSWPVFNNGTAPTSFELPSVSSSAGTGILTSDDFGGTELRLEWQFNHNPDNRNWSLTDRPGFYRITTGRIDDEFVNARNSLTQRTFGPTCSGRIRLDVSGLQDGDCAGLGALQSGYGFVGVKRSADGSAVVMVNESTEMESVPIAQDIVYLRIDMNFENRTDRATFFYSLDGADWYPIGNTLQMTYDLAHFMGYRFALFCYATSSTGGYADFDWFRIGGSHDEVISIDNGYGLTITTEGQGMVSRSPDNLGYEEGTPVTLTARPEDGWRFVRWSGEGINNSDNPLDVIMDEDKNISALFARETEDGNLVLNGDFTSDASEWTLNVWDGSADGSVADGEYRIYIENIGEENYQIQLVQSGLFLEQGTTYLVSFDAYAASERTLEVNMEMADDPWTSYLPQLQQFDLGTSKQTYSFFFTMEHRTDVNGRLGFNAGASSDGINIDNVNVSVYDPTGARSVTAPYVTSPLVADFRDPFLRLKFTTPQDGLASFRIFDMQGNVVKTAAVRAVAGKSNTHYLNVNNLPNGLYIVKRGNKTDCPLASKFMVAK
ncbi:MAG: family 43 glycosylhydrolase [Chitinispirillaceae bacterium]